MQMSMALADKVYHTFNHLHLIGSDTKIIALIIFSKYILYSFMILIVYYGNSCGLDCKILLSYKSKQILQL